MEASDLPLDVTVIISEANVGPCNDVLRCPVPVWEPTRNVELAVALLN